MRISRLSLPAVLVSSTLLFAQGVPGAGNTPTIAQQMVQQAASGPGAIQQNFLGTLDKSLGKEFGKERGGKMMENLRESEPTTKDVMNLMNGKASKGELKEMLGARRSELGGAQECMAGAVEDKERRLMFGMILVVMVNEFDVDPTSEFCQQTCGARDELTEEEFAKLMKGNVSTKSLGAAFELESKEDAKFMQNILNRVRETGFSSHPLCDSMGMGGGSFDPSKFPKPAEGMPGFGSEFEDGMAGGIPFDTELPPCPFMGESMDELMAPAEEEKK